MDTANHYHLLLVVDEQQQLSRFMQHLACNVSKEIGRLRDWSGTLWARRYDAIVVSDEPEVQWSRLKYLLSHGVKEGLVESPLEWPGVHAARALVHGEPLEGCWFNRSREWAARNRGLEVGYYDFATKYQIRLSSLPAFRDSTPEQYRQRVADLVGEIEDESRRRRGDDTIAGVETILSQNPLEPPTRITKTSARPMFQGPVGDLWEGGRVCEASFPSCQANTVTVHTVKAQSGTRHCQASTFTLQISSLYRP